MEGHFLHLIQTGSLCFLLDLLGEALCVSACAGRTEIRGGLWSSYSHHVRWDGRNLPQGRPVVRKLLEAHGRSTSGVLILQHLESQTLWNLEEV